MAIRIGANSRPKLGDTRCSWLQGNMIMFERLVGGVIIVMLAPLITVAQSTVHRGRNREDDGDCAYTVLGLVQDPRIYRLGMYVRLSQPHDFHRCTIFSQLQTKTAKFYL